MSDVNILFLASEITKGMKSIGPKCLLSLNNNMSVLDYQLSKAKSQFKHARISVLTGFENEKVRKYLNNKHKSVTSIVDPYYAKSNQTHAILTAIQYLSDIKNLFIVGSGILFKEYPKIKTSDKSTLYYLNNQKENFSLGSLGTQAAKYIFYDLPHTWSECVFLDEKSIDNMRLLNKNVFGQLYLFELINKLIDQNIEFSTNVIDKKNIFKVGSHKDILKAKRFSSI
jgi:hypothetical protein